MRNATFLAVIGLCITGSAARAQADLAAYTGPDGMLELRTLKCIRLVNTYRDDALALAFLYSSRHYRTEEGDLLNYVNVRELQNAIVDFCERNRTVAIADAVRYIVEARKNK